MEKVVKILLSDKRVLEVHRTEIREFLSSAPGNAGAQMDRLKRINAYLSLIRKLVGLLTDDEAFVIEQHYFKGVDWSRVTLEYARRWGQDYAKTGRTLMTYQRKAIRKMVVFLKSRDYLLDLVEAYGKKKREEAV